MVKLEIVTISFCLSAFFPSLLFPSMPIFLSFLPAFLPFCLPSFLFLPIIFFPPCSSYGEVSCDKMGWKIFLNVRLSETWKAKQYVVRVKAGLETDWHVRKGSRKWTVWSQWDPDGRGKKVGYHPDLCQKAREILSLIASSHSVHWDGMQADSRTRTQSTFSWRFLLLGDLWENMG